MFCTYREVCALLYLRFSYRGIPMSRVRSLIVYFFLFFSSHQNFAWAGSFKVLTFNSWLLPSILGISQDSQSRKHQMPPLLASSDADIIALQEVWTLNDQNFLITQMAKKGYPFSARSNGNRRRGSGCGQGALGNGLIVFSRFEIREPAITHPFSCYTRMDEYFAAKGVIYFEVNLPNLGWIDFYNVHLGAVSFDSKKHEWNAKQMLSLEEQGQELLQFTRETRNNPVQVIAGDLNFHPFQWNEKTGDYSHEHPVPFYAQLTSFHSLSNEPYVDTFHEGHPEREKAYTYDRDLNSYVSHGHFKKDPSLYSDYILINRNQSDIRVSSSGLIFDHALQETKNNPRFLSDHFGVMTVFETRE